MPFPAPIYSRSLRARPRCSGSSGLGCGAHRPLCARSATESALSARGVRAADRRGGARRWPRCELRAAARRRGAEPPGHWRTNAEKPKNAGNATGRCFPLGVGAAEVSSAAPIPGCRAGLPQLYGAALPPRLQRLPFRRCPSRRTQPQLTAVFSFTTSGQKKRTILRVRISLFVCLFPPLPPIPPAPPLSCGAAGKAESGQLATPMAATPAGGARRGRAEGAGRCRV